MPMKFKTAATALCLAMSLNVAANDGGFFDGNKLKGWVDAYDRSVANRTFGTDWMDVGTLQGFIAGVVGPVSTGYCLPTSVKLGQVTDVVSNYVVPTHKTFTILLVALC